MTDRFKGLTVVLDRDIREDDAEYIIKTISMIKGVQPPYIGMYLPLMTSLFKQELKRK